ncbi:MAG: ATP-binding protein [Gammaproteobacteria bacterium]|nr:ATP-binding protein [Gammaproteobacteria bacterium]
MHCLTNFKNFARAELNLFEPLTVLLGRNGSGKTNLIEGVELLATLAAGMPFSKITDEGRGGSFEVRGGLRSCVRFGSQRFGLRFNQARVGGQLVDYSIQVAVSGRNDVHLAAESLKIGQRFVFDGVYSDGDLMKIKYDNFSRGPNPTCTLSASRSVLSRYEEVIRNSRSKAAGLRTSSRTVEGVRRHLRNSYIFDPQPKAMREYARVESSPQLLHSGANLSAVLFSLREFNEEPHSALERITEIVRQIPEEPFTAIDFVETSLGDVMAGFVPDHGTGTNGTKLVDARILSDGTLRMLAIVTALETVPDRSRIVIEEFDNGLHPSRAKLLVGALAEAARRRNLNVFVTTHNPAFMDALDEKQLNSVVICHSDDSEGGSKATRLADMDIASTVGLRGGLGDFVTRGALERHLAPDFAKRRAEETREWLASLP